MNNNYNVGAVPLIAWVVVGCICFFGIGAISQKEQKGSNRWNG